MFHLLDRNWSENQKNEKLVAFNMSSSEPRGTYQLRVVICSFNQKYIWERNSRAPPPSPYMDRTSTPPISYFYSRNRFTIAKFSCHCTNIQGYLENILFFFLLLHTGGTRTWILNVKTQNLLPLCQHPRYLKIIMFNFMLYYNDIITKNIRLTTNPIQHFFVQLKCSVKVNFLFDIQN